jgi:hypothetical protein
VEKTEPRSYFSGKRKAWSRRTRCCNVGFGECDLLGSSVGKFNIHGKHSISGHQWTNTSSAGAAGAGPSSHQLEQSRILRINIYKSANFINNLSPHLVIMVQHSIS